MPTVIHIEKDGRVWLQDNNKWTRVRCPHCKKRYHIVSTYEYCYCKYCGKKFINNSPRRFLKLLKEELSDEKV